MLCVLKVGFGIPYNQINRINIYKARGREDDHARNRQH
jgi:hypothetical protein